MAVRCARSTAMNSCQDDAFLPDDMLLIDSLDSERSMIDHLLSYKPLVPPFITSFRFEAQAPGPQADKTRFTDIRSWLPMISHTTIQNNMLIIVYRTSTNCLVTRQ